MSDTYPYFRKTVLYFLFKPILKDADDSVCLCKTILNIIHLRTTSPSDLKIHLYLFIETRCSLPLKLLVTSKLTLMYV